MATYFRSGNGGAPSHHPLQLVLLLTLLSLLGGCSVSTTPGSLQVPARTRELKGRITEFSLPASNNSPRSITAGPDGALWFTDDQSGEFTQDAGGKIGRITPTGHLSEFRLSPHNSSPLGITTGPDGALWFTEVGLTAQSGKYEGLIGRLASTGQFSEFPLPTAANAPQFLTTGPDSNLWFTEFGSHGQNDKIGRLA